MHIVNKKRGKGENMTKIQVVIADTDDIYVEHLARYLMENAEQCEVSTFSTKDSFLRYIDNIHTDILLIDKGMIDPQLSRADIAVKILLSNDGNEENGYETVRKYQKTESILQEMLLKYAEATGNIDSLKGNRRTNNAGRWNSSILRDGRNENILSESGKN